MIHLIIRRVQQLSEKLELRYVDLDTVVEWDQNPKLHDIGGIIEAIAKHGFKDPPKYEPELKALGHGNGRTICVKIMRDQGYDLPRGIDVIDGKWYIPVLFGVDAESRAAAVAYALDHNNLTMSGGDFTHLDMGKMYSNAYPRLAAEAGDMVTVDKDTVAALFEKQRRDEEIMTDTVMITLSVPSEYEIRVREFLGGGKTPKKLGMAVLERMGLS